MRSLNHLHISLTYQFTKVNFQNRMKIAIIPLYKTGDKHHFTNYRPVSLLSQFSKILEKLFNDSLDKFIDKHKILTVCMNSGQTG